MLISLLRNYRNRNGSLLGVVIVMKQHEDSCLREKWVFHGGEEETERVS